MEDPMVSCPYNPLHLVKRSRLQGHIIKCQKHYPHYVICPYNATHRFPESEMKDHFNICPNKPVDLPEISDHIQTLPTSDRCSSLSKSYLSSVCPKSTVKSSICAASLDNSSSVAYSWSTVKEPIMGAIQRPIPKYRKPLLETDPNHDCWDD